VFKGAVAIVTGGASGIGLSLAKELANRGASVVIADKNIAEAQKAAAKIAEGGRSVVAVEVDVTDYASVEKNVREVFDAEGRLDYMFNNAGIGVCGLMKDFTIDDWRKVIDVNLMGVINGVQAVYPLMLDQGFGHIVNTSSMGGLVPFPLTGSYTASKYAVVGLSKSLRVEAMDGGVRVSVVCPGVVRTPLLKGKGDSVLLYDVPEDKVEQSWKRTFPADPDRFARSVLDQVGRNKAVIIVPAWWKILWWMERSSPTLMSMLMKKQFYDVAIKDLKDYIPGFKK